MLVRESIRDLLKGKSPEDLGKGYTDVEIILKADEAASLLGGMKNWEKFISILQNRNPGTTKSYWRKEIDVAYRPWIYLGKFMENNDTEAIKRYMGYLWPERLRSDTIRFALSETYYHNIEPATVEFVLENCDDINDLFKNEYQMFDKWLNARNTEEMVKIFVRFIGRADDTARKLATMKLLRRIALVGTLHQFTYVLKNAGRDVLTEPFFLRYDSDRSVAKPWYLGWEMKNVVRPSYERLVASKKAKEVTQRLSEEVEQLEARLRHLKRFMEACKGNAKTDEDMFMAWKRLAMRSD